MKRFMLMIVGCLVIASGSFLVGIALFDQDTNKDTKRLDEENGYEELSLGDNLTYTPPCDTCIHIQASTEVNEQNNTIYHVNLIKDSELITTLDSVSGRAWTQELDRNISGNSSPSPNGEYVIKAETVGYHNETGGVFLPYEPLFDTERTSLGFHVDPSWGKDNDEDGTRGCHAFRTHQDYKTLLEFINNNLVTDLLIN